MDDTKQLSKSHVLCANPDTQELLLEIYLNLKCSDAIYGLYCDKRLKNIQERLNHTNTLCIYFVDHLKQIGFCYDAAGSVINWDNYQILALMGIFQFRFSPTFFTFIIRCSGIQCNTESSKLKIYSYQHRWYDLITYSDLTGDKCHLLTAVKHTTPSILLPTLLSSQPQVRLTAHSSTMVMICTNYSLTLVSWSGSRPCPRLQPLPALASPGPASP